MVQAILFDVELLSRINLAVGCESIDREQPFQRHIVFGCNGIRAVTVFYRIDAQLVGIGQRLGLESGYLQDLADYQMVGLHVVEALDFLHGGAVATGDDP